MRGMLSVIVLLLGVGFASADAPKAIIKGKASPPAGSLVLLDASASVSEPGLALKWELSPKVPYTLLSSPDDTRPAVYLLIFDAQPGDYTAKVKVKGKPDATKDVLDIDADIFKFTVPPVIIPTPVPVPPGPMPNPPGPNPPTPTPAPVVSQPLIIVIIEESSDAVAERAAMFTNADLLARMKAQGHKWRVVDKDVKNANGETPNDLKRFISATDALPRVYLVGAKAGELVASAPAPTGPGAAAALVELLKKWGG